ncbi:PaaI family thioesterase [Slackia heliotrinireducens]|uniref:PaaI family thioesterase n=1 Tax=Slackia heliotrinireducens TaxID=84110 RepID=UPI0033148E97
MRDVNPEYVERLMEFINASPFAMEHNFKVEEMRPGYARVVAEPDGRFLNPTGGLHGGYYASLVDTATGYATFLLHTEDVGTITLDVNVTYAKPFKTGKIIAEGNVIKEGTKVDMSECVIRDEEGRLLASGSSNLMIIPGVQIMEDCVVESGRPPMPPKFLD